MAARNWRTNGLLRLRLIRRWIAARNSLGALLALLARVWVRVWVWVWVPVAGWALTCGRMCDRCARVRLGVWAFGRQSVVAVIGVSFV